MTLIKVTFVVLQISIIFLIFSQKVKGYSEGPTDDGAVTNFRNYLRINSSHPTPDYGSCIEWLKGQAEDIGLDFHLKTFGEPRNFALWMTWNGTNPALKSIMINSHMDVVAVDRKNWEHDPFEAFKDKDGNIFGRGALDMKSATVGVLEAIRRLKLFQVKPLRTIHVVVMPDEEIFTNFGMRYFANTPEFASLNVGFDLDEASASQNGEMHILYREKNVWQFNITARGTSTHASNLPEITAGQKIQVVIDKLMKYRASELAKLEDPTITIADLTSVNLVRLGGGIGNNIIPGELWAVFDMRILIKPGWSFTDVENMLNRITKEAGSGVSISYIQKGMETGQTTPNSSNIWWTKIQQSCREMKIKCTPKILSAASDGRFVRNVGIPVFGVNPILYTENRTHQDNEMINERQFLAGIKRYANFIYALSSVSQKDHP